MRLRKILMVASVTFACVAQAQDLTLHVNKKGKVGFVDKNGAEVIKCAYESAYPFSGGYAIVTKSGKSGIIDERGKVVLPLKYTSIMPWNQSLYLIKTGKIQGLASHDGKVVLPTKYSFISKPNCYGKALVAVGGKLSSSSDNKQYMLNAKLGIIDDNGRVLVTPKYKGIHEFSYNTKGVFPYNEGLRLSAAIHSLKDTLKTDCKYIGFNNDPFGITGCGLIDENGKEILKMGVYDQLMLPQSGMVRYYDIKKKQTICGYHNLDTGKGFVAAKFKLSIADIKFWTHGDFDGDIAPVNGETWSFVDKTGKILRKDYKQLKHSQNGEWAAQNVSGKWDVFDSYNQDIVSLSNYEDINFPTEKGDSEVYSVKKGTRYGAITKAGKEVIPFQYDFVASNTYDVLDVMKDSLWGAYSASGNKIIPLSYKKIVLPSERGCQDFWVMKSDSLFYHFNVTSQKIYDLGYEAVANFSKGIAHVRPVGMKIENSEVNRSQLFAPNTNHKDIASVNPEGRRECFGYLVNTNDVVLFDLPASTTYVELVMEQLKKRGNRKLTEAEKKNILLDITKENRSYDLNSVLDEDEWNY